MKIYEFYRKFEGLSKEKRFGVIMPTAQPTSMFELFQQLSQVRAQLRFFEERERYLLQVAEMGFNQIENG